MGPRLLLKTKLAVSSVLIEDKLILSLRKKLC